MVNFKSREINVFKSDNRSLPKPISSRSKSDNFLRDQFEDIFSYIRLIVNVGPVHADVHVPGAGLQAGGVAGRVLEGGEDGAQLANTLGLVRHVLYYHVSFTHADMCKFLEINRFYILFIAVYPGELKETKKNVAVLCWT